METAEESRCHVEIGCLGAVFDSVEHFRVHKERKMAMHVHIAYELYLLYEGEAMITTEYGQFPLKKGEAALIVPHTYHAINNTSKAFRLGAAYLQLYKLSAPKDPEEKLLHGLLDAASRSSVILLREQPELLRLMQQFVQAQDSRGPANAYLLRAYSMEILIHLLRALPLTPELPASTLKTATHATGAAQIERTNIIDDYIFLNYLDADITVLADKLSISEQHLRRFLKSAYGMSFSELLNRQRIQICKHLLQTTAAPVGEIWQQAGFQSSQHFSAAFKKYTGMTATQYRSMRR